jgi:hypothetical protein
MKNYISTFAAAAIVLAASAPAFSGTQVTAGNGVSLTEAAQAKFNRDTRGDDRQQIVHPGQTPKEAQATALNIAFVAKINEESRGDEQQRVLTNSGVTMATRSMASAAASRAQLIASAGLSAEQAAGMSLSEIAGAKFNRDTFASDR